MKGTFMAKTQEKNTKVKEAKIKKEAPKPKDKNSDALVGRVKKVIKKSRRKMGEEKFEKQLQRTIVFLEEFERRMHEAGNGKAEKKAKLASKDNGKSKALKADKKDKAKSKSKAAVNSSSLSTASK